MENILIPVASLNAMAFISIMGLMMGVRQPAPAFAPSPGSGMSAGPAPSAGSGLGRGMMLLSAPDPDVARPASIPDPALSTSLSSKSLAASRDVRARPSATVRVPGGIRMQGPNGAGAGAGAGALHTPAAILQQTLNDFVEGYKSAWSEPSSKANDTKLMFAPVVNDMVPRCPLGWRQRLDALWRAVAPLTPDEGTTENLAKLHNTVQHDGLFKTFILHWLATYKVAADIVRNADASLKKQEDVFQLALDADSKGPKPALSDTALQKEVNAIMLKTGKKQPFGVWPKLETKEANTDGKLNDSAVLFVRCVF